MGWLDFWRGFGSIFDIFGVTSRPPKDVKLGDFSDDAKALRGDWEAILGDLDDVCGKKP